MKKLFTNQKGFTLIELLIVIIVLALIAVLIFSYLGNPLQKTSVHAAATQIVDNMRVIDEAWNQYYVSNTAEPTNIDVLITSGILKAKPEPPTSAKNPNYSGTYAYTPNTSDYDLGGTNAKDTVLTLNGVTDEVCKKINYLYAGAQTENDPIPNEIAQGKTVQCISSDGYNVVIKQVIAR